MVSEDMGVRENGVKMQVVRKYSFPRLEVKLQKNNYELEDYVGEKALSLNLLPKLRATKRTATSFPSHLVKNT